MKSIFKILAYIKHKIIFMRYGRNYRPDTIRSAKNYLKFMQIIHKKEFLLRKKIAEERNEVNIIDKTSGYEIMEFSNCFSKNSLDSLEELKKKFYLMNWTKSIENEKKPFLIERDVIIDENCENIINDLAPIVANYIGSWPIVKSIKFWYSPNTRNYPGRSQDWHMDAEDLKQVKIYIPVEEITEKHGPMNLIPANITEKVYEKLKKDKKTKFRNQKHSDSLIDPILSSIGSEKYVKQVKLKNNQLALIDTCSCYHYGSRKAEFPRKLIFVHFTSAFSIETPIFKRQLPDFDDEDYKKKYLYCFMENNYNKAFKVSKKLNKWEVKIL